jgi:uncharacterized membrane protein YfcA
MVRQSLSVSLETLLLLALLGVAVGVFGTLVGAGGGFILTPVLLVLYPTTSASTITAISLVVVFFNALSGSIAYARQRRIDYRSGAAFAAATIPGSIVGALAVGIVSRRLFDILTAVLLAGAAVFLVLRRSEHRQSERRSAGVRRTITDRAGTTYEYTVNVRLGIFYSVGVGFVSSFLGIGGGILHVPLMVGALGFPVHVATATSHFVLANMALAGSVTHIVTGAFSGGTGIHRAVALSIGVIGGAQVGAWLSQRIRGTTIQRLLALALAGLSVRLLIGAV